MGCTWKKRKNSHGWFPSLRFRCGYWMVQRLHSHGRHLRCLDSRCHFGMLHVRQMVILVDWRDRLTYLMHCSAWCTHYTWHQTLRWNRRKVCREHLAYHLQRGGWLFHLRGTRNLLDGNVHRWLRSFLLQQLLCSLYAWKHQRIGLDHEVEGCFLSALMIEHY